MSLFGDELSLLNREEVDWLDADHATVRARLAPLLDDDADRAWLEARCAPVALARAA